MSRAKPFQLVHLRKRRVSPDTVTCLRVLLKRAEAGEIIGITYAVMEENREWFHSACGEPHRNPGFASQMISGMWYGTMKKVYGDE